MIGSPVRLLLASFLLTICLGQLAAADEPEPRGELDITAVADSLFADDDDRPVLTRLMIDERLAAMADSLAAVGFSEAIIEAHLEATRRRLESELAELRAEGTGGPLFHGLSNDPEVGIQSNVTRVTRYATLNNKVQVRGGGLFSDTFRWNYETYRRQQRTVENRGALGNYDAGELLPFAFSVLASLDWSEDVTTNAAGNTNTNRRKMRRAGVSASKSRLATGVVRHNLIAGWYANEQQAVNQQQRNDFKDSEFSGAVRSGVTVTEGLTLATRLYGIKRDGESALADFLSPSSTSGDTLGIGAYYHRDFVQGRLTVTKSSFDRRYLDYRRNSNGLIDTVGIPEASKIVEELEARDALSILWDNTLKRGRYQLTARLEHSSDQQEYAFSGVGRRERSRDSMSLRMIAPVGRDSFVVAYRYEWNWDDQRFADAASSRGRQYRKTREFSVDWFREIFKHTTLSGRYRTELSQDIAERQFNENDRDRLAEDARLRLQARWPQRFTATLLTEYQRVDDISIRASRSANNNARRTYEVAPSYRLHISPKLELGQVFRMYIQYQDHAFARLPEVQKDDTFNKRGNLASTVTWRPSDRFDMVVKHDHNQRYNGTRTDSDAAGNVFYRRDQQQTINRIELGLNWTAIHWSRSESLKLQTATYRTLDSVERLGTVSSVTDRYSGELWLGATLNRKWGPPSRPLSLDARVRRFLAYGPNVTETSRDYWEADVKLRWTF